MNQYRQLTQEQRYHISALIKAGYSQSNIAQMLRVHKSTISREIRRNKGERGYRPKQAHEKASDRKLHAAKFQKMCGPLLILITAKLALKFQARTNIWLFGLTRN